ncbi:hypothetical protein C8J57DRAFT_1262488 [Mycena rebaudengoi]|nr:hypothetical protein C8J57DRAFT_1262488 [Mycena rebaudengoi]
MSKGEWLREVKRKQGMGSTRAGNAKSELLRLAGSEIMVLRSCWTYLAGIEGLEYWALRHILDDYPCPKSAPRRGPPRGAVSIAVSGWLKAKGKREKMETLTSDPGGEEERVGVGSSAHQLRLSLSTRGVERSMLSFTTQGVERAGEEYYFRFDLGARGEDSEMRASGRHMQEWVEERNGEMAPRRGTRSTERGAQMKTVSVVYTCWLRGIENRQQEDRNPAFDSVCHAHDIGIIRSWVFAQSNANHARSHDDEQVVRDGLRWDSMNKTVGKERDGLDRLGGRPIGKSRDQCQAPTNYVDCETGRWAGEHKNVRVQASECSVCHQAEGHKEPNPVDCLESREYASDSGITW